MAISICKVNLMSVDFDKFLAWAESRWDGDVVVKGEEIRLNSPFTEDYKHKMWCNCSGGKKKRNNGVFHCWKTEERGTLVSLVMFKDKCSYEEALEILGGSDTFLAEAELKLEEIFYNSNQESATVVEEKKMTLSLPPNSYKIKDLPESDFYRINAEMHLSERKIPTDGLLVCIGGKIGDIDYTNRIIIPYYDKYGDLIYFNARYLGNEKRVPKYMGPPKELGIGKSDILYFPAWPEQGSKIHLTEGELDAKVLKMSGMWSGAFGGKEISDKHAQILRDLESKVVLCLDNDKAGKDSLPEIGLSCIKSGLSVEYVFPSKGYKDWNEMFLKLNAKIINAYIKKSTEPFDIFEWEIKTGKASKNLDAE